MNVLPSNETCAPEMTYTCGREVGEEARGETCLLGKASPGGCLCRVTAAHPAAAVRRSFVLLEQVVDKHKVRGLAVEGDSAATPGKGSVVDKARAQDLRSGRGEEVSGLSKYALGKCEL